MAMEQGSGTRDTQIKPVAGIWACDNCGRRIQVIIEGSKPKVQPFTCECGQPMTPNEEHAQVGVNRAHENEATKGNRVGGVADD